MAQRLVETHGCDEARVTLEYYPGSDAPAHGEAIVDGRRLVLDCRALTGAIMVLKLQAIFTPAKSAGREFDLKEAARWGHHWPQASWLGTCRLPWSNLAKWE